MDEKAREFIENLRHELHTLVDENIENMLNRLENNMTGQAESILSLSAMPAFFKGKKPISIMLSDGNEIMTKKWKQVVSAILHDCNSDKIMHNRLSEICGKVYGRERVLLSADTQGMDAPIKIDEGIYFESKFDTETLLKVLTERVLKPIGYDYSHIRIKITDPKLSTEIESNVVEDEMESVENEPTLQM